MLHINLRAFSCKARLVGICLGAMLTLTLPVQALDTDALNKALAGAPRDEADKARDAGRNPAGVLDFLGLEKGMTVVDVIAAGGYYTEVLSIAVGESGKVFAQNPAGVLRFRDGANDKALTARLADNRLPNVVRVDRELDDVGIPSRSVHLVITALNFHDVYNNSPEAAVGMLQLMGLMLKPGGVIGIVDHHGNPGADNAALHRMQVDQAIEAAETAGFDVEQSDLLTNPDDDRSQMVFAPDIRGKTDRFLLKLTLPED
ncbi:MAG: SAM-dependent methyltransferase [Proteobacteria bacterium]|nr:SAM-dependent methyltransferase [Pseudomonadota bacterium]